MVTKVKRLVVSHLRPRHSLPFNFASGFIYTAAVMIAITMGALFYRGLRSAKESMPGRKPAPEYFFPDLPPGSKVITRAQRKKEKSAPAVKTQAPKPAPAPAHAPTPAPRPAQAPASKPPPAPPADDTGRIVTLADRPALKPLARKLWSPGPFDRSHIRETKILPSADTSIMAGSPSLRELNGGAAPELHMSGQDSFVLANFDLGRIRGWTVSKATWNCKLKKGRLRTVGFSTITAPWTEGAGTLKEAPAEGATYRWANFRSLPWREDEAPVTWQMRGNGQSILAAGVPCSRAKPSLQGVPDKPDNTPDEWVAVPIDPVVIQALVAGVSYGLAITDEKGQFGSPIVIASREDTNDSHFIEVEGGLVDVSPPGPITGLKAYPHPGLRRGSTVGVVLSWTATGDDGDQGQAFAYEMRYAPPPSTFQQAADLPRWRIPYPQPTGERDQVIIDGLEPDTPYSFFVRALDESGQAGPSSEVEVRTLPLFHPPPTLAPESFKVEAPIEVAANALTLRIVDETAGIHPLSGSVSDSTGTKTRPGEAVSYTWDRNSRTLHLKAARNESVGFVIGLQRKADQFPKVKISAKKLESSKSALGADLRFHRVWYSYGATQQGAAAWLGDALLGLEGPLTLASPANNVADQAVQSVYGEVHVPAAAAPGTYHGEIYLARDDGSENRLSVVLDVLPLALPERPRFTIELVAPAAIALMYNKDAMNKDDAMPIEQGYHRIARDHRCALAILPYQRNGTVAEPFAPKVSGSGLDLKVASWEAWHERSGGYLSGTAFTGCEQGSEPVSHVILPVFESWPTPFEDGFLCPEKEEFPAGGDTKVYAGAAEDIYSCLKSDYWRAFRAAIRLFHDHFNSRGISKTAAHVWLNNGPLAGYSGKAPPWFLGNPAYRDDFQALESFAQVATTDRSTWPPGGLQFRVNVPDAAALGSYGLSRFTMLSVSDTEPAAWKALRERAALTGEILWFQSEAAPLDESTVGIEGDALRAFLSGADGWSIRETVGRPDSLQRAQPPSLFYCGLPLGYEKPFPSLRLKALRRAEQDIEYLRMLQEKMGWTREQLADFVFQSVPALADGEGLTCNALYVLRNTAQELLVRK